MLGYVEDMEYTLSVIDVANEQDRSAIAAPLHEYNASKAGPSLHRPLVVLLRNEESTVTGGLWGYTAFEWLHTHLLLVPEAMRGRGIGTRVMQLAEREAAARGCHGSWLTTIEFQARGFYERIGYSCFGELPGHPVGFSKFFMRKTFKGSQGEL